MSSELAGVEPAAICPEPDGRPGVATAPGASLDTSLRAWGTCPLRSGSVLPGNDDLLPGLTRSWRARTSGKRLALGNSVNNAFADRGGGKTPGGHRRGRSFFLPFRTLPFSP